MWHVYLLECSDKTLYTGITTDIDRRVKEHNGGSRGAKYTRGRRPVILLGFIGVTSKSIALKLEYKIKQLPRDEKLNYVKR